VSTLRFQACEEGDRFLGPSCPPPRLTGDAYRDFLPNVFLEVLQDADLQARNQLRWCSTKFSSCISGNSWTTCFRNSGWDEVDKQHGLLVPLI